jgi:hypothetical protein
MEMMIFGCFGGNVSKNSYAGIVLFKIREVFKQGFDSLRAEEDQHVIENIPEVGQIAGYRFIHDRRLEIEILLFEEINYIFLTTIRAWHQETRG